MFYHGASDARSGGDDAAPRTSGANGPLTPPLACSAMGVWWNGRGRLEVCGLCENLWKGRKPATAGGAAGGAAEAAALGKATGDVWRRPGRPGMERWLTWLWLRRGGGFCAYGGA